MIFSGIMSIWGRISFFSDLAVLMLMELALKHLILMYADVLSIVNARYSAARILNK